MYFDLGRYLIHTYRRILVEIVLHGAPAFDGDFVTHQVAEPFDHRALHFIQRTRGIDDLAADVASHPNFVHFKAIVGCDANFRDLRKISAMAEVERYAHGGIFRQCASTPAGFFRDEFQYAAHALGIKQKCRRSRLTARGRWCAVESRICEQRQPELHGIDTRGVREFIDERLHDERDPIAARSAHRAGWHTKRHNRTVRRKVRNEARREFVRRNLRAGRELFAFAKTYKMIAPRHELAGGIHAAFQKVETRWPIKIMVHVIFARPEQLDRRATEDLGNPRPFNHVVVGQPPAEPAAHAWKMNGDVALGDAERLGDLRQPALRRLAGHPHFEFAVLKAR